jgi:hypothetical protein
MAEHLRTARWALVLSIAIGCAACQEDTTRGKPGPGGSTAPASDQTFDDAMHIVCDAPDKAEVSESGGDANRIMMLAMWIDARVRNQEVRKLMSSVAAQQSNEAKIAALESGARRAGIARCGLAELWQAAAAGVDRSAAAKSAPAALPSEPQTYDEAVAVLCDAARRASLPDRSADPGADDAAIAHQLSTEISNPEVNQLLETMLKAPPRERTRLLREAARKSGVGSCALADRWDERQK